jgi:hypothetical protein
MPRKSRSRPRLAPTQAPSAAVAPPSTLTDKQLDRWADLIADGRGTLPDDLPSPERARLLAAVRQRLRGRMLQLVARAVAARLRAATPADPEVPTDA